MITAAWKEMKEDQMKIILKEKIDKKYTKRWKWFSVVVGDLFPPFNSSVVFQISINGIYYFYSENYQYFFSKGRK